MYSLPEPQCPPIQTNAASVRDTGIPGEKILTCKPPKLFSHGSPVALNKCTPRKVWANDYFTCGKRVKTIDLWKMV